MSGLKYRIVADETAQNPFDQSYTEIKLTTEQPRGQKHITMYQNCRDCKIRTYKERQSDSAVFLSFVNPNTSYDLNRYVKAAITEYNEWIVGNVWGFEIYHEKLGVIDACYGFYDRDHCEVTAVETMHSMDLSNLLSRTIDDLQKELAEIRKKP